MPNPLIASAAGSGPSAWAGVWIAEDIESIVQGVRSGSWIDGTLGAVGAGLDVLPKRRGAMKTADMFIELGRVKQNAPQPSIQDGGGSVRYRTPTAWWLICRPGTT